METVNLDSLMNMLKNGAVQVSFTKVDGTIRNMLCTTNYNLIPEPPKQSEPSDKNRKKSEDTVAVWDLEKSGWRSFRKDSVVSFNEAATNRV